MTAFDPKRSFGVALRSTKVALVSLLAVHRENRSHVYRNLVLVLLVPTMVHAQVLQESSTPLGHGFRQVNRSQVNPASAFEHVGHFSFVYFGDQRLCQCSAREFFIVPSGRHALFIDSKTGSVTLFEAQTGALRSITSGFVELIAKIEWIEVQKKALVIFRLSDAGGPTPEPLSVSLDYAAGPGPDPASKRAPVRGPDSDPEALFTQAVALEKNDKIVDAIRLYRRAARAGSVKAANRLGEIFDTGKAGVTRDPAEAQMWREMARKLGG